MHVGIHYWLLFVNIFIPFARTEIEWETSQNMYLLKEQVVIMSEYSSTPWIYIFFATLLFLKKGQ
jgi:hypothetical protein